MATGSVKNEPVFVLELNKTELETIRVLSACADYINSANIAAVDMTAANELRVVTQRLKGEVE